MNEQFKKEFEQIFEVDENYIHILNIWIDYRKKAENLSIKEQFRLRRETFMYMEKDEMFLRAQRESLNYIGENNVKELLC